MQYIGVDVSKEKLDCLWLRDPAIGKVKSKKIRNNLKGFQELEAWMLKNTQASKAEIHITMEATSVYHENLAEYLYDSGFKVSVVNPSRIKSYADSSKVIHKTDKSDSKTIACFAEHYKPDLWQPAPEEARLLKALLARLEAIESDLQRETNRLEKAESTVTPVRVMNSLHEMITRLKDEKKRLKQDIDDHIGRYPQLKENRRLLETIPCVGPVLSSYMLALLMGKDFENAGQVAAYLGLIPRIRESGKWKGQSRLSKRGPGIIRKKLYLPAVNACKKNPDIAEHTRRLMANGKCKMQAIGAAMRKLVQICFGVVKHQNEYRPQVKITA
ncbi:IS110 family transposase [Pelagibaculum spongiae]|uniref:IS110 family transposase n=1 Tax=Pelagibaculum spongiae TaxID=2080658 RepID=A0A2V1H5W3_9GAMM|nr:IS110 family transposase [Pelagibaculum spongiae]PVZ72607.1 IS110 family transposase [Pelagibaculum spongiae]